MNYWQSVSTCIAMSLNVILILLIVYKSPKKMGNYKYLLIYTAVFQFFYAILDELAEVKVFGHEYATVIYRVKTPILSHPVSLPLIIAYCSAYGMTMGLLVSHFAYRYGVTERSFQSNFSSGAKYYLLFLVPVLIGVWWGGAVYLLWTPDSTFDEFMKPQFLFTYNLRLENVTYVGFKYYRLSKDKRTFVLNWNSWIACANSSFIVCTSMSLVFYFGLRCYQKISEQLTATSSASQFSIRLQEQLFNALVLETVIPTLLMYLPASIFFFFPMLNLDMGYSSRLISDLIALYPTVDPLPNMFIIQSYRKAILKFLKCSCNKSSQPIEAVQNVNSTTV